MMTRNGLALADFPFILHNYGVRLEFASLVTVDATSDRFSPCDHLPPDVSRQIFSCNLSAMET